MLLRRSSTTLGLGARLEAVAVQADALAGRQLDVDLVVEQLDGVVARLRRSSLCEKRER
jgi:hypothetical protein